MLLKINTIGKTESRSKFIKEIENFFNLHKKKLSSDSIKILDRNPLRILDSKNLEDIELLKEAPLIYNFLNKKELNEFEELKELLSLVGIDYEVDPCFVRGLA